MARFFDDYPRFYETSSTGPSKDRNNFRFNVLIHPHRELLRGARVLDFASHDGRWSFAALQMGASHVIGIEPNVHLVQRARESFRLYKIETDRYAFIEKDALSALREQKFKVDVILAFGFLSVLSNQPAFFSLLRQLAPPHILIDTPVTLDRTPSLTLHRFHARALVNGVEIGATTDETCFGEFNLGSVPSRSALALMLDHFGYDCQELEFAIPRGDESKEVSDYLEFTRGAFLASLKT